MFLGREMRVPDVENQYSARFVAVVACLMLNCVIERECRPDPPRPGFTANPKSAPLRNNKRHVDDRTDVGHPGMRW